VGLGFIVNVWFGDFEWLGFRGRNGPLMIFLWDFFKTSGLFS
jgi:hypothetical protein